MDFWESERSCRGVYRYPKSIILWWFFREKGISFQKRRKSGGKKGGPVGGGLLKKQKSYLARFHYFFRVSFQKIILGSQLFEIRICWCFFFFGREEGRDLFNQIRVSPKKPAPHQYWDGLFDTLALIVEIFPTFPERGCYFFHPKFVGEIKFYFKTIQKAKKKTFFFLYDIHWNEGFRKGGKRAF